MIFDDVKLNDNRYSYRFNLKDNKGTLKGTPIERGDDWLRIRQSRTVDGEHNDVLIAAGCVCYIKEHFSRE